jgi:di/tricarboxylate transporter
MTSPARFWLLILMYYVIHYGVASQTAHVTALVPPFLGIMVDAGTHTGNGSFCRFIVLGKGGAWPTCLASTVAVARLTHILRRPAACRV